MRFPKTNMQIGIGVNLDKGVAQYALVKELGVQHLIYSYYVKASFSLFFLKWQ
jgi:hypothetical protein